LSEGNEQEDEMGEAKRIAVVGSTGRLGGHLVEVLADRGHGVIEASRSQGVDVISGEGLDEALDGVEVVIDAASWPSPDEKEATDFFTTSARNLQDAGERAGVKRIVLVSIIGADRFSAGYNVAKVAQEHAVLAGPLPVHILRAAQFHEFVSQLLDWSTRSDVGYIPEMRTQLVAARTVAEALADMAADDGATPSSPGSPIPEIAGPRTETLLDAARLLAAHRGSPARVEEAVDQDNPDRELFAGDGLLPSPGATLAGPTYEEWLGQQ
jgi:uncharacterized protein YbjT (DUF2867 family)